MKLSLPILRPTIAPPRRRAWLALGLALLGLRHPAHAAASFGPATNLTGFTGPRGAAIADFNGDGKLDLVVTNYGSGTVSVLLNTTATNATTPTFAAAANFTVGTTPGEVAVADFNGDGKLDLAVGNFGSTTVSVLLNTTTALATTPSFAAATNFTVGSQPDGVAVGDFNGDGKPDLATANASSTDVSVLLNTTTTGATTPTFAAAANFAAGTTPRGATVADFNGDGKPDLAVANQGSDTVSVLLNTTTALATTPTFALATNFAAGAGAYGVTSADFNGDGKPDLAAADFTGTTVSVLLNTTTNGATTPTFATAVPFTVGSTPAGVISADFNGDGKPDLATANSGSNDVSVLLNTTTNGAATPTFAAAAAFPVGTVPRLLASGNINGDGKPDLAVPNFNNGTGTTVSVLLNTTPTATYVTLVSFTATRYSSVLWLNWQTGLEVDNLGFNVYREVKGKKVRLNGNDLIAGSAIQTGANSGCTYAWPDALVPGAKYWLEDVDLNGTHTWHGPITPRPGIGSAGALRRSPLLGQ